MAIVHSYARFSDPSQAAGDSLRRQREGAEAWCRKHGHTLSDLTFRDLGKSGWKPNKQKALDAFLRAIDNGQVRPGEILLVEAVDRLSRKGVRATQTLVNTILNAGVSIAILAPIEKIYQADETNDIGGAIELAAFAFQASVYSENLSQRIKASTAAGRRRFHAGERKHWSPVLPAWLEWNADRTGWKLKQDHVKAIKLIFKRTAEGVGRKRLTAELNAKFEPPGGRKNSTGWNENYIARLLKTRTVLGELVSSSGDVLPNYYPAIITETQWTAANVGAANRRGVRGPQEQHVNILAGVLFSARDGGPMGYYLTTLAVPRKDGTRKVHRRYQSWNARQNRQESDRSTVDVGRFENLLFSFLPQLQLSKGKSEAAVLADQRSYLQQEIDAAQEQIKSRSQSVLVLGPVLSDLQRQLADVEQRMRDTGNGTATVPATASYRKRLASMRRGTQQERERVRDALRAIVRRVELLTIKLGSKRYDRVKCLFEVEFRNGEFARGLELPSGQVAVVRGDSQQRRLSAQLAEGWDFTPDDYHAAVELLGG